MSMTPSRKSVHLSFIPPSRPDLSEIVLPKWARGRITARCMHLPRAAYAWIPLPLSEVSLFGFALALLSTLVFCEISIILELFWTLFPSGSHLFFILGSM